MTNIIERDDGIRIFDNAAIQKSIDKALKIVPPGKKGSVVAFIDEDKTIGLAVAGKIGKKWTIVGELNKKYHKPIKVKATAVYSWD